MIRFIALQIATESSIRKISAVSKNDITSNLGKIAKDKVDMQTETLVSMIGENQVDYRFFIGFKLVLNDQELTIEKVKGEVVNSIKKFVYDVNDKLVNDFVSMSGRDLNRYFKLEKLLESKISRRLKIRKLNKNDY